MHPICGGAEQIDLARDAAPRHFRKANIAGSNEAVVGKARHPALRCRSAVYDPLVQRRKLTTMWKWVPLQP